jgi:hypothetical protein
MVVRRENPTDWPVLAGCDLPSDLGVLSVELRRGPGEGISGVVAEGAELLRSALRPTEPADGYRLWLVHLGDPIESTGRVGRYRLERFGLWQVVESEGTPIPDGRRVESMMRYADGSTGLAGAVASDLSRLPASLEATRLRNAVCVVAGTADPNPLDVVVRSQPAPVEGKGPALLPLILRGLPHRGVARAFGSFDDVLVGVEILAADSFLDAVESQLDQRK